MTASRSAVLLLIVLATPTLLAGVAVPVSAQAPALDPRLTVFVTDPGEDLVTTRPTSLEIVVRYQYPPGSASPNPVEVNLEVVDRPEWTSPAIEPTTLTFPVNASNFALGGSVERRAVANLTLDPSAPARERQAFTVKATARPGGNLNGAEAVSPEIGLQAAFVGALNVTAPEVVRVPGGRSALVEFTLINQGNGETPVSFTVPVRPKNSQVTPPEPITLARDETRVVTVELRTPWTANERGILTLAAVPDRAAPDAKTFSATARVEGSAVIPDLGVLALAGIGAAAVAFRRRGRA